MRFICEVCGAVENTANCGYWNNGNQKICSVCDPAIGKWHNHFPLRTRRLEGESLNRICTAVRIDHNIGDDEGEVILMGVKYRNQMKDR